MWSKHLLLSIGCSVVAVGIGWLWNRKTSKRSTNIEKEQDLKVVTHNITKPDKLINSK